MKRRILIICLFVSCCLAGWAQSLTVEYNIGYGTYRMSSMKSYLEQAQFPLDNLKVTDNFPGYLTHDFRIGTEWERNHLGLLFDYMNTAGNKGVADYSGSYNFEMRNKGYKLGAFYRFRLAEVALGQMKFSPYVELASGAVINKTKLQEVLFIEIDPSQGSDSKSELSGANFFVEPAVGFKLHFCSKLALNLSVGYEWDAVKKLHLAGDRGAEANVKADWSGLRAQAGLIYYVPLRKK